MDFVEEDEFLDGAASLAAVLAGPADPQPTEAPELLHRLLVERPAALVLFHLGPQLRRHQPLHQGPHLGLQLTLLVRVVNEHDVVLWGWDQ